MDTIIETNSSSKAHETGRSHDVRAESTRDLIEQGRLSRKTGDRGNSLLAFRKAFAASDRSASTERPARLAIRDAD